VLNNPLISWHEWTRCFGREERQDRLSVCCARHRIRTIASAWRSLSRIFSRGRASLRSGPLRHDHSQPLIHANSSVCPIIVDCTERVSERCPEWRVRAFKLLLAYGQILHGEASLRHISERSRPDKPKPARIHTYLDVSLYARLSDWMKMARANQRKVENILALILFLFLLDRVRIRGMQYAEEDVLLTNNW